MIHWYSWSPAAPLSSARIAVLGVVIFDDLDDRGLGGLVDLRHELVAAFLDDLQRLELVHVANHDLAGATRRANCDVDHAVHWARSVE